MEVRIVGRMGSGTGERVGTGRAWCLAYTLACVFVVDIPILWRALP